MGEEGSAVTQTASHIEYGVARADELPRKSISNDVCIGAPTHLAGHVHVEVAPCQQNVQRITISDAPWDLLHYEHNLMCFALDLPVPDDVEPGGMFPESGKDKPFLPPLPRFSGERRGAVPVRNRRNPQVQRIGTDPPHLTHRLADVSFVEVFDEIDRCDHREGIRRERKRRCRSDLVTTWRRLCCTANRHGRNVHTRRVESSSQQSQDQSAHTAADVQNAAWARHPENFPRDRRRIMELVSSGAAGSPPVSVMHLGVVDLPMVSRHLFGTFLDPVRQSLQHRIGFGTFLDPVRQSLQHRIGFGTFLDPARQSLQHRIGCRVEIKPVVDDHVRVGSQQIGLLQPSVRGIFECNPLSGIEVEPEFPAAMSGNRGAAVTVAGIFKNFPGSETSDLRVVDQLEIVVAGRHQETEYLQGGRFCGNKVRFDLLLDQLPAKYDVSPFDVAFDVVRYSELRGQRVQCGRFNADLPWILPREMGILVDGAPFAVQGRDVEIYGLIGSFPDCLVDDNQISTGNLVLESEVALMAKTGVGFNRNDLEAPFQVVGGVIPIVQPEIEHHQLLLHRHFLQCAHDQPEGKSHWRLPDAAGSKLRASGSGVRS